MDNATRRQLLDQAKQVGYTGSILDVFHNPQILDQFIQEQQQIQQQPQQFQQPQPQVEMPTLPATTPNYRVPQVPQSEAKPLVMSNTEVPIQIRRDGGILYDNGGPKGKEYKTPDGQSIYLDPNFKTYARYIDANGNIIPTTELQKYSMIHDPETNMWESTSSLKPLEISPRYRYEQRPGALGAMETIRVDLDNNSQQIVSPDVMATKREMDNVVNSTINPAGLLVQGVGNIAQGNILEGGLQTALSIPIVGQTIGTAIGAPFKFIGNEVASTYGPALSEVGRLATKQLPGSGNVVKAGFLNPLEIADAIIPQLPHPARIPLMGASVENMGPFTGSPLNFIPGYGQTLKASKNAAFRKFGNTMEHVIDTKTLSPKGGMSLRIGKDQIVKEGNWAALNAPDENYKGVFAAKFDFKNPNTNLGYVNPTNRNGVLIKTKTGDRLVDIPIQDEGLSFYRRLPFSNRYVPINKEKLLNNEFQLSTQGGYLQSLAEKYGYGLGYAGALGALGVPNAVEKYNKYTIDPIINWYKKQWEDSEKPMNAFPEQEPALKKSSGVMKFETGGKKCYTCNSSKMKVLYNKANYKK
jgi:hypothetical protein